MDVRRGCGFRVRKFVSKGRHDVNTYEGDVCNLRPRRLCVCGGGVREVKTGIGNTITEVNTAHPYFELYAKYSTQYLRRCVLYRSSQRLLAE